MSAVVEVEPVECGSAPPGLVTAGSGEIGSVVEIVAGIVAGVVAGVEQGLLQQGWAPSAQNQK